MDKASLMHSAQHDGERDTDSQEMRYFKWSAKQSIDWRTARIFKHQRQAVIIVRQRDGPRRPVRVKFGFKSIFVFKPLDGAERRSVRGNKQDRRQAVAGAPVERDMSLPKRRECVARELVHEGLPSGGLL